MPPRGGGAGLRMRYIMASISTKVLRVLLGHASPSTPAHLRPWVKPPTFGENGGYTALARLTDAGTSVEALDAAGLSIQGETLDRQRSTMAYGGKAAELPDGEVRRARYYAAGHRRSVAYQVAPASSPSGLRPASLPGGVKAPVFQAWYASLVQAAASATGDTVEIPTIAGTGDIVGGTASPRSTTPRASGPFGRFQGLRTLLGSVVADMTTLLESADDPEATKPAVQALTAWALQAPVAILDTVGADSFDVSTIRVGSPVVFVDGSPALRVASFKLKAAKVAEAPMPWHVQSITDGVATLEHNVTCKLSDLRRYVAPRPVEAVPAAAWKPSPDALATWDGQECLVVSISTDGEVASIIDGSGEMMDVAVESLSAPSA